MVLSQMLHDGLEVRVLKAFPELMILLKGMLAVRTLAWCQRILMETET